MGLDQPRLGDVQQGTAAVADQPGAVQAAVRPEPARAAHGQVARGRRAGQHGPRSALLRGQLVAARQHHGRAPQLQVPISRAAPPLGAARQHRLRALGQRQPFSSRGEQRTNVYFAPHPNRKMCHSLTFLLSFIYALSSRGKRKKPTPCSQCIRSRGDFSL